MRTREIGAIIIGAATLIVTGFSIFKIITGKEVGFNEVIVIGPLLMMFFLQLHGEIRKKKTEYYRKKSLDKELWKKLENQLFYSIILYFSSSGC